MSARMGHWLRRKCYNEETPSKFSKSLGDRDSETLSSSSSSHKSDKDPEKVNRRKKIRSTQDFNHLNRLTLLGSEETVKHKAKKTKKTKTLYSLPKISYVVEDLSAKPEDIEANYVNDTTMQKKGRKKSRKQTNLSQESESDPETNVTSNHSIRKTRNREGFSNANSASGSNRDSEVEISSKNKRVKTKKRNKARNTDPDVTKVQIDIDECYAKRIKELLSDEPIRRTRSGNTSTSTSFISTPVSNKKTKRSSLLKIKRKTKSVIIKEKTPTMENDTTSKRSISVRLSRQSTPHPKLKLRVTHDEMLNEEEPIIRKSEPRLSENVSPASIKTKQRSSTLSEYVSFDMDFESDDVFVDPTETPIGNVKNNKFSHEEAVNKLSNDVSVKVRKSVRFKSPEQNIRRETLILSKPTLCHTPIKISFDESKNDVSQISDLHVSTNGSTKRNRTFEISSPRIANSRTSFLDVTQSANDNSHNLSLKHSEVNLSRPSMNNSMKRKSSSVELFSPQMKSFRKSTSDSDVSVRNAIKNLTTPPENTVTELNKRSNFCNDFALNFSVNTPRLIRTATFTKDDETLKQASDETLRYTPNLEFGSPLHPTASKPMDTSKVTKRKRWDKSRLSVSCLDNSVDIGNISAPWLGNESNNLLNLSVNMPGQKLEIKNTPTVVNIENRNAERDRGTPPSASSTPFPKGSSNLLKKTLLKEKQNVTVNEDSKVSEKQPSRKIVKKAPNFALIHQRALDKIENIKEMSERKALRAKLLLSGHKPSNDSFRKTPSNRKELKFSPTRFKSTPLKEVINRGLLKSNISVSKISKVSPSTSNPKVPNKENRIEKKFTPIKKKKELLKMKSHIPVKSKVPNTVIAEKKGFTRFGFKQKTEGAKVATKDEQVRAVAQKTKIVKNLVEERRTVIQGVRSNRRFELLMQRRNKC